MPFVIMKMRRIRSPCCARAARRPRRCRSTEQRYELATPSSKLDSVLHAAALIST
jgi:hypothetical protein